MDLHTLNQLASLIESEREALLLRWRQQVRQLPSARQLDIPTLNDHVPSLLYELSSALRQVADQSIAQAMLDGTPPKHGVQRFQDGFDIVEVVAEYNILRGCINDLAEAHGISLLGKPFHILNRVLDEAIGLAVQTFATQQALEVQRRRDEYLAFVAHDLRTPLSAISLAARVLAIKLKDLGDGTDLTRMQRALQRNVKQLEGLIQQVLAESGHLQADSGMKLQLRVFDLWPQVEALLYDMQPLADTAGTHLRNEVPEDLSVFADASALQRVLQNLLGNAIRYAPRGQVVVEARAVGDDGDVQCTVRDNGAGIAADRLAVVFDKLETDAQEEGGTGLGLAIVKSFVEAHGGTVWVDSQEGAGSAFHFTLPGRRG